MSHDEIVFWELVLGVFIWIGVAAIMVTFENRAHRLSIRAAEQEMLLTIVRELTKDSA